jgi:beta-lactam-binding protein with PASTA domain
MTGARKLLKAAVIFLGFALLVFASAVVTMKVITYGETERVPAVTGQDVSAAIGLLKNAGLEINVDRQEHHPSVPAGSIISQSPPAGSVVKRGRNVSVVVSQGSEEVTAPSLVGEPLRHVQVSLKQAGLNLREVVRAPADEPRDVVTVQYPEGQAAVQKGSSVDLLVSDGPREVRYITPELVGKTLPESEAALRPMAVRVATAGNGRVIVVQEPKAGYPIAMGGDVRLTLGNPPPAGSVKTPAPAPMTAAPAPPATAAGPGKRKEATGAKGEAAH